MLRPQLATHGMGTMRHSASFVPRSCSLDEAHTAPDPDLRVELEGESSLAGMQPVRRLRSAPSYES